MVHHFARPFALVCFLILHSSIGQDDSSTCNPTSGTCSNVLLQKHQTVKKVLFSDEITKGLFDVSGDGCEVEDNCVMSKTAQRQKYANEKQCQINVDPKAWTGKAIKVANFQTEDYFDTLTVNGKQYSGARAAGLDGITPTATIEWTSDYSITRKGWKLCAVEGGSKPPAPSPPNAPMPAPYAPMPAPSPNPGPSPNPAPTPPSPPSPPSPSPPCGEKGTDTTPLGTSGDFGVKIVNGQVATECEWKWQASLRQGGHAFCGGALIHPKWVFSAAHCVPNTQPSSISVVLGDHDKDNLGTNESAMQVTRIISHPNYNPSNMDNDFALLELTNEATMTGCIGTVCIPDQNDQPVGGGTECFITGWGTLQSGGSQPRFLQEAKVSTLTNTLCDRKYSNAQITNSMLCAQGRNSQGAVTDACQGDSGGPLVCMRNGKYYLEGATSWGYGCADPNFPGIWARLTSVTAWTKSYVP